MKCALEGFIYQLGANLLHDSILTKLSTKIIERALLGLFNHKLKRLIYKQTHNKACNF